MRQIRICPAETTPMLRRTTLFAVCAAAFAMATPNASAEVMRAGGTGSAQGLLQRLGEAFGAAHPEHTLEIVPGLGSSGGITAVSEGVLDLSVSSRVL
jgi:phosphate transport system substrate-binding protein